jgi:uncharacterized membrane protein
MNLAHIHLLLNHFPTIGTIIGLGLFLVSLVGKSDVLKRASLVVLLGIAIVAIPTYVTGNAAQEALCKWPPNSPPDAACMDPGVPNAVIQTHEGAAMVALLVMEIMGAFAWLGLWQFRRFQRMPGWNLGVVLVLGLATLGLMSRAANIGGEIRHPEILAGPEAGTPPDALAREMGLVVVGRQWVWPTCETLHFVGLSLLLGVVFLVDLRMLGVIKNVSFPALHRLMPWAIFGFGVNVITGMLFFVGNPGQYTQNVAFQWKIAFVLLAALNALYFTMFDEAWEIGPGDEAPLTAKIAAMSAVFLWVAVLYCGSMLPFIGMAF